jgi:glucose-6-phosphate 1-dehydrogenase
MLNEARGWRRVVAEKPFGTDLASAERLNAELREHLREDQILRIDHYLGKETVQNILALRFQNAIFEPLWNRQHVESVEISVCEQVTMEGGRGAYYDGAGALRDMLQNHVLQVLSLVAMDAPHSMDADEVRGQKVRVLEALTRFTPERVQRDVVRAQYVAGNGHPGYLEEAGVAPDSTTETYVAVRANVQNWRWNGVPFLLRTGKGLAARYTDITLRFRVPPVDLLGQTPFDAEVCALRPNALRIQIQPREGIRLGFLVKQPGSGQVMRQATLGFAYDDLWPGQSMPANQRLLLDALEGNRTLFIRGDEVAAAWRFVDGIREGWADAPVHTYPVGSWGPAAADDLFRGCEGIWGRGDGP